MDELESTIKTIDIADYVEIIDWYRERGILTPPAQEMIGAFSPQGKMVPGIAAGFLYLTGSTVALLDGYVTNPHASKKDRSISLDLITKELISLAKEKGIKHLKCNTEEHSIYQRAMKFGFGELGRYYVLVKNL